MLDQIKKSLELVDRPLRWPLMALALSSLLTSALETSGVGAVFAFFQVALNPQDFDRMAVVRTIHHWWGADNDRGFLGLLCALVFLVFLARTASQFLYTWLAVDLRRKTQIRLASTLFEGYLRSPYAFHLRTDSSALYNNVTYNTPHAAQNCVVGIVEIASSLVLFAFFLAVLLWLKPLESMLAFVVVGTVAVIYWFLLHERFARWGAVAKQMAELMFTAISDPLHGIKTVKILDREDFFWKLYRDRASVYAEMQLRQGLATQIPRIVFEVILVAGLLGTMGVALANGTPASEVVPTLALFGAAAFRLMPGLVKITSSLQYMRFSKAGLDTVHRDVMRFRAAQKHRDDMARIPPVAGAGTFRNALTLSGVTYRYDEASRPALDNVSMTIKRGEYVAFAGLSGSGKTTLADVILGLLPPEAGTLTIDGVSLIAGAKPPPGLFGYVPQDAFLINDTFRRNIGFGVPDIDIDDVRLRRAAQASALDAVVANLPQGIDSPLGERGIRLSGGERQRLGLARALYFDPQILVLDEPTSALDALTEAEVSKAIMNLRGRKTIITIAHRLSTIRNCDRLFFLEAGQLVDSGPFDELVARNAAFRAMVDQLRFNDATDVAQVDHKLAANAD
jgi:ABC-type multidrug transport system fused ATPase/permease subunit